MIETKGLGAGSYPEPPTQKTRNVEVKISVDYITEIEVPEDWDSSKILEDIKENLREYISESEIKNWEADYYGL